MGPPEILFGEFFLEPSRGAPLVPKKLFTFGSVSAESIRSAQKWGLPLRPAGSSGQQSPDDAWWMCVETGLQAASAASVIQEFPAPPLTFAGTTFAGQALTLYSDSVCWIGTDKGPNLLDSAVLGV